MNQFALGVDIGGTHITAAVVNLAEKNILPETIVRYHVDAHAPAKKVISDWSKAILEAGAKYKSSYNQVGIAMPGPFDYEKGIALMRNQGKYDALYGLNVMVQLAQNLLQETHAFKFENDAACFLLGEAFAGAAKGYERAIGLTLGTGLGSATYNHGIAKDADLWKMPFHENIAEEYLSSRWFVKRFSELTGQAVDNVKSMAALLPTEPAIQQIFEEFACNLAQFLKFFVQLEQPEVIILGGNISKAYHIFGGALTQQLHEYSIKLPVKLAESGEEAALLGAASLWSR